MVFLTSASSIQLSSTARKTYFDVHQRTVWFIFSKAETMRAIEQANQELQAGRPWRAKEILQGSLRHAGYDVELFEKLGTVLLTMGDLPEAGRYLFLSARRDAKYDEAIRIFISRHRNDVGGLYQTFPRVAKLNSLSEYPEPLRGELEKLGFPQRLKDKFSHTLTNESDDRLGTLIGFGILGAVVMLLILGVIKIFEIVHWITHR